MTNKSKTEQGQHQTRVLQRLDDHGAVVVAHGMGSGKTLTALLAAEKAHKEDTASHVTMVVPASLESNVHSQIKQHGVELDPNRFHVTTYDKAVNNIEALKARKHSLVILDEAHKIRNTETSRSQHISKILKNADKTMLLTGTPAYNKPHELGVLVNRAAGEKIMPDDEKSFEEKFIGKRKVHPGFFAKHVLGVKDGEVHYLKNQQELKDKLGKYVDTYDARHTNAGDFPSVHHKTIKVEMDDDQAHMYKYMEGKMSDPIRWKVRLGLPLSKRESRDLNAFASGVRQVSNHVGTFTKNPDNAPISPKVKKMADSVQDRIDKDPNYRGISYSTYLESGLKPLSKELTSRNIPHAVYDGSLNKKQKDDLIEKYNKGEVKHLLVSSSGAEGLNLKGTKLVQVMEPHFNKSKIDQVVARGVRFKSHEHLPENERHVDVEHYHSIHQPSFLDKVVGTKVKSIDEYLSENSDSKERVKEDIMGMLKAASTSGNIYLEKIAEMEQREVSIGQGLAGKVVNPTSWALRSQTYVLGRTPGLRNVAFIEGQLFKLKNKHDEARP